MKERPNLRMLADHAGILPAFIDCDGAHHHTQDATRQRLLSAMGFDVSSEEAAGESLQQWMSRRQHRMIDPVRIIARRSSHETVELFPKPIPLQQNHDAAREWRLSFTLDDGSRHEQQGTLQPGTDTLACNSLSLELPWGYHALELQLTGSRFNYHERQLVIIAPDSCYTPPGCEAGRQHWGLCTHLATVRGARDRGIGHFGNLAKLVQLASRSGASFVGLNPIHATLNRGWDFNPYQPATRLYRNPLYLDIDHIPELSQCLEAQRRIESAEFKQQVESLRLSDRVQFETINRWQRPLLEMLYGTFEKLHLHSETDRGRDFRDYLQKQGDKLLHHATFMALDEHFQQSSSSSWWGSWPPEFRDLHSPQVQEFARHHSRHINLHCYIQFELDRQLRDAARGRCGIEGTCPSDDPESLDTHLALGLYQDLALGSGLNSSEGWAYPELFIADATVGAPPDPFARHGQNWGLPPINPIRLQDTEYWYWRALLSNNMEHSGLLRIDHVMGLARQFWIPRDRPASEGAYVRFPADDLFAILALESHRHRVLVIGEDLGTVPPGFRDELGRWGLLSSRVVYFEQVSNGEFLPANQYPHRSLVTLRTHDLAPLASFWEGSDIILRQRIGLVSDDDQIRRAHEERGRQKEALIRLLANEDLLGDTSLPIYSKWSTAMHRFLRRTPALLVGCYLDDLIGQTEPLNLPGVGPDQYPSWSLRLTQTLDELLDNSILHAISNNGLETRT